MKQIIIFKDFSEKNACFPGNPVSRAFSFQEKFQKIHVSMKFRFSGKFRFTGQFRISENQVSRKISFPGKFQFNFYKNPDFPFCFLHPYVCICHRAKKRLSIFLYNIMLSCYRNFLSQVFPLLVYLYTKIYIFHYMYIFSRTRGLFFIYR